MTLKKLLQCILQNQKGYVISLITFFILMIMLSTAISMSALTFYSQKISTNQVKATQSYYAAESGIEDALLRLKNNPELSSLSYTLMVGGASSDVTIPAIIGGSRAIVAQGNALNRIRKIQVVYTIDSQGVSFHYGAQVGEGGLVMDNGSRIQGNVFSNGNISGGNATIDNDVIVAGNNHSIDDITIKGNALTYSCLSPAVVEGNLTYVSGGTKTCTVQGTTTTQSTEINDQPLPISQDQIDEWKTGAAEGSVINGNVSIGNNDTQSLGPVKIIGNLTLGNNAILNVTGTIYVTGNISFGNTDTIRLDASYGSLGGVIVIDGSINTGNTSTLTGSGQSGSYLLILSTSISDTAIVVSNNAGGAIFYTSAGGIELNNNVTVKEVTGYKLKLNNNAVVAYESGLANTMFSSGPSGGWKVTSWQEK